MVESSRPLTLPDRREPHSEIFFVADEVLGTDLFGEPVLSKPRGRGRPAHRRSRETVNRVILGLARGWKVKEVALSIGVSVPTLREHYSSELERRHAMALMLESVQLARLNDQAEKGNVAAEKELMKALEKGRLHQLAQHVANRGTGRAEPKPKPERLGKKAELAAAAKGVEGKYAPPPAPLLN